MSELPPPDLMDRSGRARRLVLALIVGAAAAAAAFVICDQIAKPDEVAAQSSIYTPHVGNAYRFVWYFTGLAGAIAFIVTLKILNWRANKKYIADMTPKAPQARVVK